MKIRTAQIPCDCVRKQTWQGLIRGAALSRRWVLSNATVTWRGLRDPRGSQAHLVEHLFDGQCRADGVFVQPRLNATLLRQDVLRVLETGSHQVLVQVHNLKTTNSTLNKQNDLDKTFYIRLNEVSFVEISCDFNNSFINILDLRWKYVNIYFSFSPNLFQMLS